MKTRLILFLSLLFCVTICFTACDKGDAIQIDFEKHIIGTWEYEKTSFIANSVEYFFEDLSKLIDTADVEEDPEQMAYSEMKIIFNENHEGEIFFDGSEDSASITWELIDDDKIKITVKSNPHYILTFVRFGNSIYFELSSDNSGINADYKAIDASRTYLSKS